MAQTLIDSDVHVNGNLTSNTMVVPNNAITNASVSSTAAIAATKLEHQFSHEVAQLPGTAVVAETRDIRIVQGAGSVVAFKAAITGTIATGGDRTVTVDLHKGTVAAGFATICSATIGFSNTDALRTAKSATVSSPTLAVGDILRVVITVAGAAGNQALGLIVSCTVREAA